MCNCKVFFDMAAGTSEGYGVCPRGFLAVLIAAPLLMERPIQSICRVKLSELTQRFIGRFHVEGFRVEILTQPLQSGFVFLVLGVF
jgi:hypothetical protein